MNCLHPYCPMSPVAAAKDWSLVVDDAYLNLRPIQKADTLALLNSNCKALGSVTSPFSLPISGAASKRLLELCPCLFTQIDEPPTAAAIVHLCEISLGHKIDCTNVHEAYLVQHPSVGPAFKFPPVRNYAGVGGTVMEYFCSEVLSNEGIEEMSLSADGWPIWRMPGHVHLNRGKLQELKALGDILIPCAPTNIIISVKTEAAKERLLYSANSIEGIGFGFFRDFREFHTTSRMALFKRMGFSAIYMPVSTYDDLTRHLDAEGTRQFNVNINGKALYRPFTSFGDDMRRIVGKSSIAL
jgi:hypothetical protein